MLYTSQGGFFHPIAVRAVLACLNILTCRKAEGKKRSCGHAARKKKMKPPAVYGATDGESQQVVIAWRGVESCSRSSITTDRCPFRSLRMFQCRNAREIDA